MNTMTLRTVPVDRLTPAPYNPRTPLTKKALAKLKKSLMTFGLVEPLVWNERTGYVVGGHARLRILKDMGVQEVAVSVVDLDDEHERALNVMLNNMEAQGRYDREALRSVLEPLRDLPVFESTGFDASVFETLTLRPQASPETVRESETYDVCLTVPKAVWDDVRVRLDSVVADFDLRCHVKQSQ